LPFADGSFEAVFCSDAFHYFISKKPVVQELKRLTRQSGLIILSWVHNAQFRMPHDGLPLPPQGYQELFADMPSRMVPDDHVLGRYLKKHGPALSQPTDFTLLAKAPLLSIVASPRQNLFQDYGPFTDWPHAEGRLRVNPLFREQQGDRNGGVILRRTYPSAFYEADHAESNNYLPERVELERQIMDDSSHRSIDRAVCRPEHAGRLSMKSFRRSSVDHRLKYATGLFSVRHGGNISDKLDWKWWQKGSFYKNRQTPWESCLRCSITSEKVVTPRALPVER
jgi:hypothetical protein